MRILSGLTRLYPVRFREEYARQLEQVSRDEFQDAATPWERLKAGVRIAGDVGLSLPVELAN